MILLNGEKVNLEKYPNGETKVDGKQINQLLKTQDKHNVVLQYENDADLIHLMFVKRFLDDLHKRSSLIVYYMPYSRMDRVENDLVFTLKYISEFINSMKFENVTIYESHSDVSLALVDRSENVNASNYVLDRVIFKTDFNDNEDYIYYPDASAEKRYSKFNNYKSLVGLKQRDFDTGRIKKLDVVGELPTDKGFNVIMIDDLCSRGGTFLLGAKKLKELGAEKIYLAVAHCENSIFEGELLNSDLIDGIYTTDTMVRNKKHPKLHVYKLGE